MLLLRVIREQVLNNKLQTCGLHLEMTKHFHENESFYCVRAGSKMIALLAQPHWEVEL